MVEKKKIAGRGEETRAEAWEIGEEGRIPLPSAAQFTFHASRLCFSSFENSRERRGD